MPETTNGTLPSSAVTFDVVCLIIEMFWYPTFDGQGNFQNIPRKEGFCKMGRNVRDKLHKKISKSQVERKKIVFLPTCI